MPGAERIVPAIARLNRFAAAHGIPVVSTTDAHAEDDPEFAAWPPHCVAGTLGQRKAEATLLDRRVVVPNRDCDWPSTARSRSSSRSRRWTLSRRPNLRRMLDRLDADRSWSTAW